MISTPLPASTGEKEGQEERGGERTSGDVEDRRPVAGWGQGRGTGKKLGWAVGRMEHFPCV